MRVIVVPQIEGLRVKDIVSFAKFHFDIDDYFAEGKSGIILPSRTFICNIGRVLGCDRFDLVNSIIPDEFKGFIQQAMDNREQAQIEKKSLMVKAKPEFVKLFRESQYLSSIFLNIRIV